MVLTELQKKITFDISERNIKDIKSFFLEYCDYEIEENTFSNFGHGFAEKKFKAHDDIYFPKSQSDSETLLMEYVSLFQVLSREGLIFTMDSPEKGKEILPIFRRTETENKVTVNERILTLIKDLYWKEIIVTSSLKKFIERDFKTEEEFFREQEILSRERAQKLTRNVAYASISASVLVTIIVAFFNYLTYSNERVVTIKSSELLQDTVQVKIVDPKLLKPKTKVDSDSLNYKF